jgi:hypothetical protein
MAKKSEDSNKNKDLIPLDEAESLIVELLRNKAKKSVEKYYTLRMMGFKPQIAAAACNYNKDYGYKLDKSFRDNQNLQARMGKILNQVPEQYQNLCKLRLIQLAEAEGKAIEEYNKNPKLLIDKPQLAKHLKQSAGVLNDDEKPQASTINIKEMRQMMVMAGEGGNIPQIKRDNRDTVTIESEETRWEKEYKHRPLKELMDKD